MKRAAVLLACFVLVSIPAYVNAADKPAATPQATEGNQEIVVKAELKIKIQTDKPEIDIKTDINDVADKVIKTEDQFLALAPEDVKDVKMSLPATIYQERTDYHADLSNFEETPIFNLRPKIQKVDVDKWSFKVTDLAGNTVKNIRGNGGMPEEFVWDGFDEQGNIMKLGSSYMWKLNYMDKAGNPGYLNQKEPRVVNAIKYRKEGKLILEVSQGAMFQEKRKEYISDAGQKILTEVKDYIKMSNSYPVIVRFYSEDKGLAQDQIGTFEKELIQSLKLPKGDFVMEPYQDTSVPQNRRVVFIIKG
jgi:hypothetical protein